MSTFIKATCFGVACINAQYTAYVGTQPGIAKVTFLAKIQDLKIRSIKDMGGVAAAVTQAQSTINPAQIFTDTELPPVTYLVFETEGDVTTRAVVGPLFVGAEGIMEEERFLEDPNNQSSIVSRVTVTLYDVKAIIQGYQVVTNVSNVFLPEGALSPHTIPDYKQGKKSWTLEEFTKDVCRKGLKCVFGTDPIVIFDTIFSRAVSAKLEDTYFNLNYVGQPLAKILDDVAQKIGAVVSISTDNQRGRVYVIFDHKSTVVYHPPREPRTELISIGTQLEPVNYIIYGKKPYFDFWAAFDGHDSMVGIDPETGNIYPYQYILAADYGMTLEDLGRYTLLNSKQSKVWFVAYKLGFVNYNDPTMTPEEEQKAAKYASLLDKWAFKMFQLPKKALIYTPLVDRQSPDGYSVVDYEVWVTQYQIMKTPDTKDSYFRIRPAVFTKTTEFTVDRQSGIIKFKDPVGMLIPMVALDPVAARRKMRDLQDELDRFSRRAKRFNNKAQELKRKYDLSYREATDYVELFYSKLGSFDEFIKEGEAIASEMRRLRIELQNRDILDSEVFKLDKRDPVVWGTLDYLDLPPNITSTIARGIDNDWRSRSADVQKLENMKYVKTNSIPDSCILYPPPEIWFVGAGTANSLGYINEYGDVSSLTKDYPPFDTADVFEKLRPMDIVIGYKGGYTALDLSAVAYNGETNTVHPFGDGIYGQGVITRDDLVDKGKGLGRLSDPDMQLKATLKIPSPGSKEGPKVVHNWPSVERNARRKVQIEKQASSGNTGRQYTFDGYDQEALPRGKVTTISMYARDGYGGTSVVEGNMTIKIDSHPSAADMKMVQMIKEAQFGARANR